MHLVLVRVHDTDAQHQLLSIVIVEDTIEIVTKSYKNRHHVTKCQTSEVNDNDMKVNQEFSRAFQARSY